MWNYFGRVHCVDVPQGQLWFPAILRRPGSLDLHFLPLGRGNDVHVSFSHDLLFLAEC